MGKYIKYILIFLLCIFVFKSNVHADNPSISYITHMQDKGWTNYVSSGISGITGQSKRMESIKVKLNDSQNSSIYYRTHIQDIGWQDYKKDDEISGTVGMSKRLEAIQIKLEGNISNEYDIYYRTHIQDIGWQDWKKNDEISGTVGMSKRLEAIEIKIVKKDSVETENEYLTFNYKSYIKGVGWQNNVNNGEISGTVGESKPINYVNLSLNSNIEGDILYSVYSSNKWQDYKNSNTDAGLQDNSIQAIKIKLLGELSNKYDVYYKTHVSNIGWLSWTKNDNPSGSIGFFNNVEAIQIKVIKKYSEEIDTSGNSFYESNNKITYSSHVSDIGWMNYVNDGQTSGTVGKSKKIESIKIKLDNSANSSIVYSTYIKDRGWQENKKNDEISGTVGESRSIEAIKIKIDGKLSNYYDVYYRTHVSNIGWLSWAKNNEKAGSVSNNTNVEALEIKLISKTDSKKPTDTSKPYVIGKWNNDEYKDYFGRIATGFKVVDGIKYYFNNEGKMIGKNVKKVIDVSSWQNNIDWQTIKNKGDVDEAIIRVGWGMSYDDSPGIDSKFDYNIKEVQRLGIPYGIYIYGYAEVDYAARNEAKFVVDMMQKYNIPKDTYVWYDAEINTISLNQYKSVIPTFIEYMNNNGYKNVGVYGSLNNFITSNGNLNDSKIRSYPLWVAQYYKKIQYPGKYIGWQYTSDGSIEGINGRVDVSMFYK